MSMRKKSKAWHTQLKLLFLALALPVSAGWVGDSLLDLMKKVFDTPWKCWIGWPDWTALVLGAVASGMLFGLVAFRLYKARGQFLTTHARVLNNATPDGRTVLIMGLSHRGGDTDSNKALEALPIEVSTKDKMNLVDYTSDDKEKNLISDLMKRPPSWQQSLRTVWHHVAAQNRQTGLRAILVVSSTETSKNFIEFRDLILNLLKDAKGRDTFKWDMPTIKHIRPLGVNFEDYDSLIDALNEAVNFAETHFGANHSQVSVDVTGGSKIFSIAAAMVTLNRKSIFSYMNNEGNPCYYDAKIDMGTLGEG